MWKWGALLSLCRRFNHLSAPSLCCCNSLYYSRMIAVRIWLHLDTRAFVKSDTSVGWLALDHKRHSRSSQMDAFPVLYTVVLWALYSSWCLEPGLVPIGLCGCSSLSYSFGLFCGVSTTMFVTEYLLERMSQQQYSVWVNAINIVITATVAFLFACISVE